MQKKTSLLLAILSTTLFSCGTLKNTEENSDTVKMVIYEHEDKSDVLQEEEEIVFKPTHHSTTATKLHYVVEVDSTNGKEYQFEIPESFAVNTDSLLESWQARNLLHKLDCNSSNVKIVMTDTMYAKRLASIPAIVRMKYNGMVRSCIDRYTRNRSQVSYMLGIAELYMPFFEQEIDRMGLPQELKYLPVIESALNPTAVSRMGAKGLWQFIISTSKAYGLVSNNYVEERYDPIKSTRAALEYLKDLYEMFGNWELALASYNCGPGNVNKAIKRSGGKTDFWEIYPYLPQETRGYVPGFIAANYIMTFYEDHGICPMEPNLSVASDTVHVNKNLHFRQIVNVCGADINELRAMNPQYIRDIVPGENGTYTLRLTNDVLAKFVENEDAIYNHKVDEFFPDKNIDKMLSEAKLNNGSDRKEKRETYDKKSSKSKKEKGNKGRLTHHKIRKGESLGSIASKYRVTVKQIMKWNNLKSSKINAGKTLKIYK